MKERPILFNAEMVNAVLSGRKTQTRRLFKFQTEDHVELATGSDGRHCADDFENDLQYFECPYGKIGDQIWVRETFSETDYRTAYRADINDGIHCIVEKWTPSIHMPRWASRIQLEITGVRVERLNDISEEDAVAEGCDKSKSVAARTIGWCETPVRAFNRLWKQIYGADSWQSNPWVWVVEFKKIETSVSQ